MLSFETSGTLIDLAGLEGLEGMRVDNNKPQKIVSSSPLVTVYSSWTVLASSHCCLLPKKLNEKEAKLHHLALSAELTVLTQEDADYVGVKVEGRFKVGNHRY